MTVTIPIRLRRFQRLVEVSRILSDSVELEPMLHTIVETACELTLSEASSIYLYEEETGLLKFVAAPTAHLAALKRIRVPLENSIAGKCYTESKSIIIQDAKQDERIFRVVDNALEFKTNSLIAVPLIYRQKTIGVLEAINKQNNANYTEDDVTILETLASHAGVAIQNTHLLERAQRAYNELSELDRMKSDFVAITSHELRTPLGLILGHATVMRESASDPMQKRQIDIIVKSALRLKKIIEDLENMDKFQAGKEAIMRQKINMNRLIEEVITSFKVNAERKHIKLISDLPDTSLTVQGDPEKIAIAVGNLIKNAITFTDENGHVMVSADNLPGYIKVSVVDDGIGIPAKDLHRVFERFFQVDSHMTRRHGGMGLGLSVAKVMIELHGGQIWAESIEGKGSNFSFLLPTRISAGMTKPAVFESEDI